MYKYKIGDNVLTVSNEVFEIIALPGISEFFPDDYEGIDHSDGLHGLISEHRIVGLAQPDITKAPMQVKIKKLSDNAVVPKYSKSGDAGLDLTATSYEYVNGRHVYGTSLAIEIPAGYVGLIFPRSSICKYDLRLTNSVGVIDSGYRGEIKFQFENDNMKGLKIVDLSDENNINKYITNNIYNVGDRIGQLLIIPYPQIELVETEELSTTERADGGFGHTGQ